MCASCVAVRVGVLTFMTFMLQVIDRDGVRAIGGFTYLLKSLVDPTRLGATNALQTFEFNTELKLYVCLIDFTAVHILSLIQAAFANNAPAIVLDLQITA